MLTLKAKFLKGIRWNGLSTIGVALLELFRLFILIRLLEAEDFGLFALATIVLFYIDAFKDLGFSGAIIHKKINQEENLSSIFWMTVVANALLALLTYVSAPLVASFFDSEPLIHLIQIVSTILLIGGLGTVFQSILIKEMEFKKLAITSFFSSIIYFSSSIYFAYHGLGVMALVYGLILKTVFENLSFIVFGSSFFKPKFHFSFTGLSYYVKFGSYQLGERAINVVRKELDTLLIGKFLGTETLGFYTVMKNLIIRPYTLINPLITNVTLSYMSKLSDNLSTLKNLYLKQLNILTTINVFIYFFLAVFALEFVQIYYGPAWVQHRWVFVVLSIATFFMSIANPVSTLIISTGRADKGFYWNIGAIILYTIALVVGIQYNLFYLALAILIVQVILFLPNYIYLIRGLVDVNLREYIDAIYKPVLLMTVSVFISFLIVKILGKMYVSIAIGLLLSATIYSFLIFKYQKESLVQLRSLISRNQ